MLSLSATTELLGVLGDSSRVRLLALLDTEELTVAELVQITGLSQSRVSSHLGRLKDAGLVRARRSGASALYRQAPHAPPEAERLWTHVRGCLDDALLKEDVARRDDVLAARRGRFPESFAGQMERHYSPGRTWEAFAYGLAGLLELGDVLDVGCGDGAVAALLAPAARHLVCLDRSERMLEAARRRLSGLSQVELVLGDMHEIPLGAESFDRVALFNVLSYSQAPTRVLSEAYRVLRPGGAIAIQTLNRHLHMDIAARYGHVRPGFSEAELSDALGEAGFEVERADVVARERKAPHFEVLRAVARRPGGALANPSRRNGAVVP